MREQRLTAEHLPMAVQLARGVFNSCLRPMMRYVENIGYFEEYVTEEHLGMLMEQGRLMLWGIYDNGRLVAVSGMQSEGHITMLYVLPVCQRRGYGKQMLSAMKSYAKDYLNRSVVTVNVMPPEITTYFQKNGFRVSNSMQPLNAPFVPMYAKAVSEVRYDVKPIPEGWLIGTTVGGLGLCMMAVLIYMVSYCM